MRLRLLKREKMLLESAAESIKRATERMGREEVDDEPRLTRKEKRLEARVAQLPQDRKCPECHEVVLSVRSWVVKQRLAKGLAPCCRRCHFGDPI
jgi:transcription elongation factor Elf1